MSSKCKKSPEEKRKSTVRRRETPARLETRVNITLINLTELSLLILQCNTHIERRK
jgi:hypothetical protein